MFDATQARGATIIGKVTDASSGTGIEGIAVRAQLQEPGSPVVRETSSDAEGRFEFGDLPPGNYAVSVHPPPNAAVYEPGHPYIFRERNVVSEERAELLQMRVSFVSSTISGRVTDEEGRPIEGAEVVASPVYYQYGNGSVTAVTDSNGRYLLHGLCRAKTPGIDVEGDPLGGFAHILREDPPPPVCVYKLTFRAKQRRLKIHLVSTEDAVQVVDCRLSPGTGISGLVTDCLGKPLEMQRIWLLPLESSEEETKEKQGVLDTLRETALRSDERGHFFIEHLWPGTYEFRISIDDDNRSHRCLPGKFQLEIGKALKQDFQVSNEGDLEVCVKDYSAGFAIPASEIRTIYITSEDGTKIDAEYTTDRFKTLIFSNLPAGNVTVFVEVPGFLEADRQSLTIPPGDSVRCWFSMRGTGTLSGRVPTNYHGWNHRRLRMRMPGLGTCLVESDGQGEFRAEGLRSGRFLLSAYLMNSKIHAVRLESRWITVEEGSTTRVDFDMSGTAWLHGTVSFSEVVKLRNGIVVVWPNDILEPIPCGDEDFLTEHALAYASGEPKETTKSFEYDIPQLPEGVYKATAHWYTYEETEDGNREGMKNIRTVTRIVTLKAGESLKIDFDEKEALPCVEPEKEETRDS